MGKWKVHFALCDRHCQLICGQRHPVKGTRDWREVDCKRCLKKKGKAMGKRKAYQDFTLRLVKLQHEAGTLGLWRTAHQLHEAQRKLGTDLEDFALAEQMRKRLKKKGKRNDVCSRNLS